MPLRALRGICLFLLAGGNFGLARSGSTPPPGVNYFDEPDLKAAVHQSLRRLQSLGYKETIEAALHLRAAVWSYDRKTNSRDELFLKIGLLRQVDVLHPAGQGFGLAPSI